MAKSTTPLESFGPELLAALVKGGRERVEIPMHYRKAVLFRRRLYQLRTVLRTMGHEKFEIAARARIQILWGERAGLAPPEVPDKRDTKNIPQPGNTDIPAKVVLSPHDSEFTQMLKDAGVEIDLQDDPLADSKPDGGSTLESFLDDIKVDK